MPAEIHVGDIGTVFEVDLQDETQVVDVASATVKEIIFRKPDGTKVTKPASFTTNGADGKIQYATESGFLDASGTWKIQAKVTLTTGTWFSDISKFTVFANL